MNKSEIEQWLKKYNITNYTIHDNLVVDVNGDVDVSSKELTKLPFQFGKVTGKFDCGSNNLTSLQYCPTTVGRDFSCSNNPFKVTKENEAQWIKAIKNHKDVYEQIKDKATPQMTKVYKLMWEV